MGAKSKFEINPLLVKLIALVDSVSRNGPGTPICAIHYEIIPEKSPKHKFEAIKLLYLYYSADFLPTGN